MSLLLLCLLVSPLNAQSEWVVDRFRKVGQDGIPAGWKALQFKKVPRWTEYSLVEEHGDWFVQARSSAAASALVKDVEVPLKEYPVLTWRWKVERSIRRPEDRIKRGDDYAARVYIAFKYQPEKVNAWQRAKFGLVKSMYGDYPPHAALNYIWDSRLSTGTVTENPYYSRIKIIVLRSGDAEAGQWRTESRDVYADYRRFFNEEPPPMHFISLMTDTDNTGESVTSWYDDIVFQRE